MPLRLSSSAVVIVLGGLLCLLLLLEGSLGSELCSALEAATHALGVGAHVTHLGPDVALGLGLDMHQKKWEM